MKVKICLATLFSVLSLGASAQTGGHEKVPQISVVGVAKMQAKPDVAILSVGVTQMGSSAQEVSSRANEALAKIVAGFKSKGAAAEDIQTTQLSLRAERNEAASTSNRNVPKISGYIAEGSLNLRTRNLSEIGNLIALAMDNGANQFDGVRFEVSNSDSLMEELTLHALRNGRQRAERYASALGVKLGRLLNATPGEANAFNAGPMRAKTLAFAGAANIAPPVEAGETELIARVNEIWEIAPQ